MNKRLIVFAIFLSLLALALIACQKTPPQVTTAPIGLDGAVFSALDEWGRAGDALAVLSRETLDEGRDSISSLTPSGYVVIADEDISGGYLFNRCHLIAAQLARGTEVLENLVTGTRQMNLAMLEIENRLAAYIKDTGEHVVYRVSPDFHDNDLICRGVAMAAFSLESDGLRIFEYIENAQDGVEIDYSGGNDTSSSESCTDPVQSDVVGDYVLNTSSHRFHKPDCQGVSTMKAKNRQDYHGSRALLIEQGYKPCGSCNP